MSKINTNMAAVTTLYHLTNKEGSMNKALERISSGLRLNHAVDDAAGASIVNRMTSQIKGLEAAIRNAADAISLTQTAEGSLEEVTQILHRMRELSVQAANGVYTGQDRQAINNEIVAMQNELQRIAESSTFNGVKMLNGDFQDTTFQVGFQPNDTATLSIEDVRPSGLGEYILSTSNIDTSTIAETASSTPTAVASSISANEAPSFTFKAVDSSSTAADGVLSSALQSFVSDNTAGATNGGWSVSGTDASLVSIDSSGVVTVTGGTDFESKASYSFDVVFTTAANETFTETVDIQVSDLAEEFATIATPTVPTSVKANDTFTVSVGGTAVTATIAADNSAFTLADLKDALNAQVTTLNTATAGTIDGEFSVSGSDLVFTFATEGDIANVTTAEVAEVQTSTGFAVGTALTNVETYTLTIGTNTWTTTTNLSGGANAAAVAADLDAVVQADATTNFSVSESNGQIVVTYDAGVGAVADATISISTNAADTTGFTAGSFAVTTQGVSAAVDPGVVSAISHNKAAYAEGSSAESVAGVTAVVEVQEVITVDLTGTAAAVAGGLGTDVITLTSDGTGANTVSYTTALGDSDTDIAAGIVAALAGTENFTATSAGAVITITMNAGTGAFDETNLAVANTTNAGNVASSVNVTTTGVSAVTGVAEVHTITLGAGVIPTDFEAGETIKVTIGTVDVTHTLSSADATAINSAANQAAAVALLAGHLDTAANTADSGADVGWGFTESGGNLVVTANATGDANAVVSGLKIDQGARDLAGQAAPAYTDGAAVALTTATNADRDVYTGTSAKTTLDVVESTQVFIRPLYIASPESDGTLSQVFQNFVADNPAPLNIDNGGFSLSGADAALFEIDKTGIIKSKGPIDFDAPGSAAGTNVYDLEVVYTNGTNSFTETVSLNITDNANDGTYTSAAAQPFLGQSKSKVGSLISEKEDLTIFGNVGTKVIDVNGGSSARDVVTAVNAVQGETGVYADAQTRVNISFPDQSEEFADTVSFKLYGKNGVEQVISGNVDFGVEGGRDANVRNLADAVNSASGATGITAKVSTNGAVLTLVSNDGYDIVIEGYAMSANDMDMFVSAADGEFNSIGIQQSMQEGTDKNNSARISGVVTFHSPYIFSISADATGETGGGLFQQIPGAATLSSVADLNVLTVDNAQKMLTAVDGALVRVDLERSDLGATMSRMEHTIRNLSNINVNTKAARSRIQDADIAAETVELNRAQVLSQAAQAMLAQANRTSQSILTLLQG